ncbi:hypothetical protein Dimus_015241 [Dionaea muscipula]
MDGAHKNLNGVVRLGKKNVEGGWVAVNKGARAMGLKGRARGEEITLGSRFGALADGCEGESSGLAEELSQLGVPGSWADRGDIDASVLSRGGSGVQDMFIVSWVE